MKIDLCKSIIRGLVKRNHGEHTMLEDVGEKQEQDVRCFDDILVMELPWHEVRQSSGIRVEIPEASANCVLNCLFADRNII